jgi:two-component system cell cycle sensor histidine kinase/response regulator CckA
VERLNQEITKEIHERRVIEEHLRTAQSDLEQRIAERTADLAQANARLQQEVREHRLTEGARLSSEKRFNYLTDNLNQGVWFARAQPPQVLYVNPAFERIWGLPAARFYDNPKLWRDCVHPDDQRMVTGSLRCRADESERTGCTAAVSHRSPGRQDPMDPRPDGHPPFRNG